MWFEGGGRIVGLGHMGAGGVQELYLFFSSVCTHGLVQQHRALLCLQGLQGGMRTVCGVCRCTVRLFVSAQGLQVFGGHNRELLTDCGCILTPCT